mgnify:CR=1 FL=1
MYAFTENEKLTDKLRFVRDEFVTLPDSTDECIEDEVSRLQNLGYKLSVIILEYEQVVNDHYERLEEEREQRKDEVRKEQLFRLSTTALVDKLMESLPRTEIDEFLKR